MSDSPPQRSRWPRVAGFVALIAIALSAWLWPTERSASPAPPGSPAPGAAAPVTLRIDLGEGPARAMDAIPWRAGMTVRDVLDEAARQDPALRYASRGAGESAFLQELAGRENEGGGAERRNWQFWVNQTFSTRSFAVTPVPAGAIVEWRYDVWDPGRYRPDDPERE